LNGLGENATSPENELGGLSKGRVDGEEEGDDRKMDSQMGVKGPGGRDQKAAGGGVEKKHQLEGKNQQIGVGGPRDGKKLYLAGRSGDENIEWL